MYVDAQVDANGTTIPVVKWANWGESFISVAYDVPAKLWDRYCQQHGVELKLAPKPSPHTPAAGGMMGGMMGGLLAGMMGGMQ
eukprot:COSAG01_NODE_14897_length_1397_cov_2.782743_2_plen_83_part_00